MMTFVVGDIHGCYVELQALLDKAGLGEDDSILAVGDVVDRGPETPQVLDFFHSHSNARALMGNHERKHVRASRGEIQLSLSQRISRDQLADRYPVEVEWMSALPLHSQLHEVLVVHGFFEPKVPLADQLPSVLCGTLGGAKILNERYDRPWYELYDSDQPLIVGHQNYTDSDQPFIYKDRVFGLDTSCVVGKSLTGILLPSFRILSVPSRGDLWERVRREYKKANRPRATRIVESWTEQDHAALEELIKKTKAANQTILARLRLSPRYNGLNSRQQAKLYAEMAGDGPAAVLLQMARLGKLDLESARRVVRGAARITEIARQLDELKQALV
ncbi:MAG TPA: metallophosphoesterase family protein [Anaerolineales bacterium]|nr:metallophosphoesterase family protein [Anaerolineales bacterium]